jgi:hypothetical protein
VANSHTHVVEYLELAQIHKGEVIALEWSENRGVGPWFSRASDQAHPRSDGAAARANRDRERGLGVRLCHRWRQTTRGLGPMGYPSTRAQAWWRWTEPTGGVGSNACTVPQRGKSAARAGVTRGGIGPWNGSDGGRRTRV